MTIPAPKFTLGGNDKKYLFHNSTLALDADTGKIKWYYQHVVDHWDLDHPFERLLVETAVSPDPKEVPWINPKIKPGERRKVITGIPGKTGLVYTLDRQTGEFLWARPTVLQNVISKIDGATGEVTVNPESTFSKLGEEKMICPSAGTGGKNWPAGAYNPRTNVMFYPLQNVCMNAKTTTDKRDPSLVYGLNMPAILAPGTDKVGTDLRDLGRDRQDAVEVRAARRHDVARGHRRRAGVRRRRQRPLPRLRRPHRQDPVGAESRRAGRRLSR